MRPTEKAQKYDKTVKFIIKNMCLFFLNTLKVYTSVAEPLVDAAPSLQHCLYNITSKA
jgi:hypothetical protein